MSIRTHASSWRSLLAWAPALGAAFIVMGALQGEPAILLSRTVYLVLVPVSLARWWIARQLALVMSGRPVVPIAQAMAGDIALRGQAQPMPGGASARAQVKSRRFSGESEKNLIVTHEIDLDRDGVVDFLIWQGRYQAQVSAEGLWEAIFGNIGGQWRLLDYNEDADCT